MLYEHSTSLTGSPPFNYCIFRLLLRSSLTNCSVTSFSKVTYSLPERNLTSPLPNERHHSPLPLIHSDTHATLERVKPLPFYISKK